MQNTLFEEMNTKVTGTDLPECSVLSSKAILFLGASYAYCPALA